MEFTNEGHSLNLNSIRYLNELKHVIEAAVQNIMLNLIEVLLNSKAGIKLD